MMITANRSYRNVYKISLISFIK